MFPLLLVVLAYLVLDKAGAIPPGISSAVAGLGSSLTSGATSAQTELAKVSYAIFGTGSNPATWYGGVAPGTVTIGGAVAPDGWNPNDSGEASAQTGLKLAGAAAGATLGIAGALGATASGGIFAAGGSFALAGTALPIIGIGVAIAATVLAVLAAHHAAALAAEGKALNDSDARMLNAQVMVLQGVLNGEIPDLNAAESALQQITGDWYGEVSKIEKGTWHYTGLDMSADFNKVWKQRYQPAKGAPGFSDYHAPDPCNGACVIGHFFVERNVFLVLAAATAAIAGSHGVLILPAIPAHDTQLGFPEIRVTY